MKIRKFRKQAKFANETSGYECAETFTYDWTVDETNKEEMRKSIDYWKRLADDSRKAMEECHEISKFYLHRYNFLRSNDFAKQLERMLKFA